MKDIDMARQKLQEGYSIVVVKDGLCIFTHHGNWIHPMVAAFETLREQLHGAAVADRVVGKAAAVLCIMSQIDRIYTPIASRSAVEILSRSAIPIQYDVLVDGIINQAGTGLCLAEKTLLDLHDPPEAFAALWRLLDKETLENLPESGGIE